MRGLCLLLVGLAAHAVAGPVERAIPSEQAMRAAYGKRGVPEVTRQVFPMEWEGRRYRIFVSAPKDGPPPPQGYPVLYVTDGNGTFDTAAQAGLAQSSYPEVTGVGPAIVVGIGYETDLAFPPMRAYDLSPPDPLASQRDLPHERVFGSGGADLLLDFIERGLGPEIARRHPVDTTRLGVFGHSRGGLFVLHTLFTRPHLFRYYIAASPAIWWHDGWVLDAAQGFIDRYVFPDGELTGSGRIITEAQDAGLEVLHEENLRPHYALTLRDWCANLVEHWDEAVAEIGLPAAKVWGLYMAGSRLAFESGGIELHHVLAVNSRGNSDADLPLRPWWTP